MGVSVLGENVNVRIMLPDLMEKFKCELSERGVFTYLNVSFRLDDQPFSQSSWEVIIHENVNFRVCILNTNTKANFLLRDFPREYTNKS